jgi:hypothetical protein
LRAGPKSKLQIAIWPEPPNAPPRTNYRYLNLKQMNHQYMGW